MEELAIKIAELLDITVEAAIKLYPVLRSQFVVYEITRFVGRLSILTIMFMFMYIITYWVILDSRANNEISTIKYNKSYYDTKEQTTESENKIAKKQKERENLHKTQAKKFYYCLIPLTIYVASRLIQYIFATDLVMMKQFL